MNLNLGFSAALVSCLSLHMLAFAIPTSTKFFQIQPMSYGTFHYLITQNVIFIASVGICESRYIVDAEQLYQWFVTLSSKNGCFQAHLLIVYTTPLSLTLIHRLETLANDLGCFPLDPEPSHSGSVCRRCRFSYSIRSFLNLRRALAPFQTKVLYPYHLSPTRYLHRFRGKPAKTKFGGISLLTAAHPSIL
jgi:hypothetical protein